MSRRLPSAPRPSAGVPRSADAGAMRRRALGLGLLSVGLLVALLPGCGQASAPAPAAALPAQARVLALGDSLTAGQGAATAQSWPAQLARLTGWRVDNAGRNGDTSAGALARLRTLLAAPAARYDAIVIGIGGNDMLRSVPQQQTVDNIRALLQLALTHSSHVALLATPQPDLWRASLGQLQDAPFYAELAQQQQVLALPDIYTAVLNQPALRSDQIHANAEGYGQIARQIATALARAGWRSNDTPSAQTARQGHHDGP